MKRLLLLLPLLLSSCATGTVVHNIYVGYGVDSLISGDVRVDLKHKDASTMETNQTADLAATVPVSAVGGK